MTISDNDNHNPAYIRVTGSDVAMRRGPHSSCGVIDRFSSGTDMYPWCYVQGDPVTRNGTTYRTWSRVHLAAVGDPEGWISDAYLSNGGADNPC
ncbi:hypothetical protein Q0Z83_095260 [Actinoplanes sichuanensis]|uniref:SH3 domain-containing protein n=1 Tax=Actinoplanes sichuanensis TaxID=512349 RepID=A0ABW4ANV5_9ACTN|nr:hypothetical protein [Actinoplanes sichuanensis]BEL11335.1 hypothetical protein Q0Z83_095260 [Actinoplanes sichuanensis]